MKLKWLDATVIGDRSPNLVKNGSVVVKSKDGDRGKKRKTNTGTESVTLKK